MAINVSAIGYGRYQKNMSTSLKRIATIVTTLIMLTVATTGLAASSGYRSPEQAAGATTVSADEAKWLFDDGAVFIDVRNPRYFARRHIPGAHHLDMKDAFTEEALAAVAEKDQPIVIYASGIRCGRAHKGSRLAASWGYKKVYYFRGGIIDWKVVKFPIVSGEMVSSKH